LPFRPYLFFARSLSSALVAFFSSSVEEPTASSISFPFRTGFGGFPVPCVPDGPSPFCTASFCAYSDKSSSSSLAVALQEQE